MSRLAALATRLVDEAREAITAGEFELASDRLLDALEVDPGNAIAARLLEDHGALKRHRTGERKQLTVIFTDQVGSTAFVARHGAEATTRVFRRYHELFGAAVEVHGGLIQSFQGDGLVACFGHPVAHGNDAERAVNAALAMLDSLEPLERMVRDELDDVFAIRIAVHTGDVVVAELGTAASPLHHAITGVTPNVTARLQDLAGVNEIIVSDVTARLLPPQYLLHDNGSHSLKGIAEPMQTHIVGGIDRRQPNTRFRLSPHIGRTAELATLETLWQEAQADDARGRSGLITGEPGLGKSRMLASLRDQVQLAGGVAVSVTANDQELAQPLRGLVRGLSLALGGDGGLLDPAGDSAYSAEDAAVVNTLVAPLADSRRDEVDPMVLRREALERLEAWIVHQAAQRPICFQFDDFQWIDPSTRAWVVDIATRLPAGVAIIIASRDVELGLTVDSAVELFPLDKLTAESLVANLIGKDDPERVATIVANADGVPLFLEELTRSSLDRIPATLRELVQAELEPESLRYFAQAMATIGRTVHDDTLVVVGEALDYDRAAVDAMIDRLVAKDLIQRQGSDNWVFRHHLVWQAAYESQLDEVRLERHGLIGDALAGANGAADSIGRNYLLARRPAEAATFLLKAAAKSQALGAHPEALAQLALVSEALELLPPEMAPVFEVGLRMRRATSTIATSGYADANVSEDFATASEMCRALAGVPELAKILSPALVGLWSYYTVAGDFVTGPTIIKDLRALEAPPVLVDMLDGMDHFFRGDLDGARALLAAIESDLDDVDLPADYALLNDPGVCGLAVAGAVAIASGDGRADELLERALARAATIPFPMGPFSAALAHTYTAMAHGLRRQHDQQARHGAKAHALGERHGFLEWSMLGNIHVLAGRALSGEPDVRQDLAEAVAYWRTTGAGACVPALLAFQAELELDHGTPSTAAGLIAEATEFAEVTAQGLGADLLFDLNERLTDGKAATS